MIGLVTDILWYPIGQGDFVHSFFSTICYNLEGSDWGSKYPYVMNKLYNGGLDHEDLLNAMKEVSEIRDQLKAFPPQKVVWDIEDLSKQPPWGDDISDHITDLSNYFVTCEGKDLFEVLLEALEESEKDGTGIDLGI